VCSRKIPPAINLHREAEDSLLRESVDHHGGVRPVARPRLDLPRCGACITACWWWRITRAAEGTRVRSPDAAARRRRMDPIPAQCITDLPVYLASLTRGLSSADSARGMAGAGSDGGRRSGTRHRTLSPGDEERTRAPLEPLAAHGLLALAMATAILSSLRNKCFLYFGF